MPGTLDSPGAANSMWYELIGSAALYVPAGIPSTVGNTRADQCVIVQTPAETPIPVWNNDAAWTAAALADEHARCRTDNDAAINGASLGFSLPCPASFIVHGGEFTGDMPNYPSAILESDGVTVKEMQPFCHGSATGTAPDTADTNTITATSVVVATYNALTGTGVWDGSHGGSGAPALFGTVRIADNWTTKGATDDLGHALKIELWAEYFYDPASGTGGGVGYRAPATKADAGAGAAYGSLGSPVSGVQPGARLALLPTFNNAVLETTVGKVLANTLKKYGCFIVDSTSWDAVAFCTELSPDGSVRDDFTTDLGFDFNVDDNTTTAWGRDIAKIISALQLVTNASGSEPAGPSAGVLFDMIGQPHAEAVKEVRINGVLIHPSAPTADDGIPGVISMEYDDAIASITMNNCPLWIEDGMPVTIDAGLRVSINGVVTQAIERQWTGFIIALPGENPDYLRDRVIVKGAVIEVGTAPDNVQQQIAAQATLVGADIRPPLPAGVHIEHEVPNNLVHTLPRASWMASQYIARFGQVPRYPSGEPGRQTIVCAGEMYKTNRAYQLNAISLGGMTDEEAIQAILALAGVTNYSLIEPEPGWYTLALNAAVSRGRPLDMLALLWEIGQLQPVHTRDGVLVMRQVKWGPAPTSSWSYDITDQAQARILSTTGELEVIWNPFIEKFSTGYLKIPFLQVDGRHFVETVKHVWPEKGMPVTRVRAMGGSRLGGTLKINPVATFTYKSIREAFGDDEVVIATFTDHSFDPDGVINQAASTWTSNQTTIPDISDFDGLPYATVRGVTSGWTGAWTVTRTVVDNDGLDHSLSLDIPYDASDNRLILPATYAAMKNNASASMDGDITWFDQSGSTCMSVGAKPADGTTSGVACYGFSDGHIGRTMDGCQTALTTVLAAVGSPINYIAWDWRNVNVVWALAADMRLYRSQDAGVTWALYDALRTALGLAGAIAGRRCIGLPAAGGVYVFGGDGAGTPLIAFDAVVDGHAWQTVAMTGDAATDFPADATMRIVDFTAPGYTDGREVMILEFASGGGGGITGIYSTVSPPGTSREFTRATGLTAGLKNGKYIVGDNPLMGTLFHAAFGDRDVWDSTDGIAWTKKANVMPAGITPNDCLFMSDVLTGITGLKGVYMVAAQNAGHTLGLYKSSDGLTTVDELRPSAAGATWPSGADGLMLAVGATGDTVTASGQLARLGTGATLQTFDNSSNWLTKGATAASSNEGHLVRFANGHWLYQSDVKSDGDIYHSPDGVTFTLTLAADANRGVYGFDVAADGTVWAVMGNPTTATGTNSTKGLLVYKSVDWGENWTLEYTDAGYSTNFNTSPLNMIYSSPIACDKFDANNIFILCAARSGEPDYIYSTDGATFTQVIAGSVPGLPNINSQYMNVSFANNGRLLVETIVSSVWGIYYSDDVGASWTASGGDSMDGTWVRVLGPYKPSWANKNVVTNNPTGAEDGRLFITRDNGLTWTDIGVGDVGFTIQAVEFDPATDTIYLAGESSDGVWKITGAFEGVPTLSEITFNAAAASSGQPINFLALPL